ncbi:MAG: tRNA-binding protein [Flavobacteriia bacterium]|nr:tRNA-binding protein [Flavobacteriia bacterium]
MGEIDIQQFFESELHVGTIIEVEALPNAHVPAWVLTIDFGPLGIKTSSARITRLYDKDDLIGEQIIAVTNLPPRQVGKVKSECLVLGLPSTEDSDTEVVLLRPERPVDNGTRVS